MNTYVKKLSLSSTCGDSAQTKIKSELYNNTKLLPCIDVKAGQKRFEEPTLLWTEAASGALISTVPLYTCSTKQNVYTDGLQAQRTGSVCLNPFPQQTIVQITLGVFLPFKQPLVPIHISSNQPVGSGIVTGLQTFWLCGNAEKQKAEFVRPIP